MSYVPNDAGVKNKMLYAATRATLKRIFGDNRIATEVTGMIIMNLVKIIIFCISFKVNVYQLPALMVLCFSDCSLFFQLFIDQPSATILYYFTVYYTVYYAYIYSIVYSIYSIYIVCTSIVYYIILPCTAIVYYSILPCTAIVYYSILPCTAIVYYSILPYPPSSTAQ